MLIRLTKNALVRRKPRTNVRSLFGQRSQVQLRLTFRPNHLVVYRLIASSCWPVEVRLFADLHRVIHVLCIRSETLSQTKDGQDGLSL